MITHGILMRWAQGSGGELGQVTIQANGLGCVCGNRGCPEALASGIVIQRRGHGVAVEQKLIGEDVTRLAREGDKAALSVLQEVGRWLGIGLAGFVNAFNPEVVAIASGVAKVGELILEATRARCLQLQLRSPTRDLVEVMEATPGPGSGVLGAAAIARIPPSGEYVLGT